MSIQPKVKYRRGRFGIGAKKTKKRQARQLRPSLIRQLFQRFGCHLRPHRPKLVGAALCMVGATAMEILRPWPLKVIFDGLLIPQKTPHGFVGYVSSLAGTDAVLLAGVSLTILAIAIFYGLFGFGQAFLLSSVGQRVVAAIRLQLYKHIQRLSHSFHDEHSFGDLLARLTGDVRMMRELLVNSIIFVSSRSLMIVGTLTVMFLMDWRLSLVAVFTGPVLWFVARRFGSEIKGAAKKQRRKESQITQVATERIMAIKIVQAYAREAYEEERFARENNSSATAGLVATRLEAHLNRLVQVILACGTCGVIWFGVVRVQAGALTPGDLLVFTAYLAGLYKPVGKLASLTGRIAKATVCGERIVAILDLEPEIKDLPDAKPAPAFSGEVAFEDVTFAYSAAMPVIRGVTFRINPGETVALVGESGSGKSTIASLILRFYDPMAGSVTIDGIDIRKYTLSSLRQQIAIVPQDTVLFHATIHENIAYGRLDATMEEIVEAAKAANAHDFISALPEGYETLLGERGDTLSGGQRQRIAIARATVCDAPIVILDEAMAGLDKDSETSVRQALGRLTETKTCFFITHDLASAAEADRVLLLKSGRLTEVSSKFRATFAETGMTYTAGKPVSRLTVA